MLVAAPVSFERDVLPILEHRCNECHHPEEMRGGLDLTRLSTILRGGDEEGPAVVAEKPEESPMILMLTGEMKPRMPKKADPLPEEEIDVLRTWVAEGAHDDTPSFSPEDIAFFEREIRPILFESCFKCHAGDEAESGLQLSSRHGILIGGDRGPAAIPGAPEQSLLLAAVRHEGDLKMPKGGDRLTESQTIALQEWIRRGIPWPSNNKVLTREKLFTISEADRNHWSFRPLPSDLPNDWSIDTTLVQHWKQRNISPTQEAEKYQLLRRVTFDLIGYPPTVEEMEAFVNDESEDAFEKVVDRLLSLDQFGWRWGRHWLDYTRNGANGQPNRGPKLDSDRYATWVAKCFNEDRPWDWFARVHLAGDKMPGFEGNDFSPDQALAAAIPLNGPRTFEEAATQTFVLMDKLDEGIEFMGRSLMGISLECARCHDHKFDPVSQRDYYALLGFFQSSWFAPVPLETETREQAESEIAAYRNKVSERARLNGLIRRQGLLNNVGGGGRVKKWQKTRIPMLTEVDKRLRELELAVFKAELADARQRKKTSLAADLQTAISSLEKRLENHRAPEYTGFGSLSGYSHFIGGHKSQLGLIKRAEAVNQADLVGELEEQLVFWREERERWIVRSRFGGFAKSDPEIADLAQADDRITQIKGELAVNPIQPWIEPQPTHLYVRADGGLRRAEDLIPLDKEAKAAGLQFNSNNPDRVLMHPYFIGDSRFFSRGDVLYPEDLVPRATPAFFGSSPTDLEGSGRLQLANWLTRENSTQAALIARNTVNRAWQQLFGEGLCRTPKELGRLGEQPDMPDLIDGLAARFIANDWSMKSLIREIVLSEAYRRSSTSSPSSMERDPDNRFFARQNVRRLEYEPILNMVATLRTDQRFDSPKMRNAAIPGANQYRHHFDGPSVYELLDRRVASISATQALFLMNNRSSATDLADSLTRRLNLRSGSSLISNLDTIYSHVLQRLPTAVEQSFAKAYVERRRQQAGEEYPAIEIREFITLLLCGNELLYLE